MSDPCNHILSSFSQVLVATAISILPAVRCSKIVPSLFLSDWALNCASLSKLSGWYLLMSTIIPIVTKLPWFDDKGLTLSRWDLSLTPPLFPLLHRWFWWTFMHVVVPSCTWIYPLLILSHWLRRKSAVNPIVMFMIYVEFQFHFSSINSSQNIP